MVIRVGIAVVAVLVLDATSIARACEPAVLPGAVGRLRIEPAGFGQITDERAEVTCDDDGCEVSVVYTIQISVTANGKLATQQATSLSVTLDGSPVEAVATPAGLTLAAGTHRLELHARLPIAEVGDCFEPGLLARHPWFGGGHPERMRVVVIESGTPVVVRHPRAWRVETWPYRIPGSEVLGPGVGTEIRFIVPASPVLHGGPFLLGGVAGGEGTLLRLRAGWEIAVPEWLVWGLSADTDADSTLTLAATAEAITEAWILPMTWSLGVGRVVRVAPEVQPGARAFVSFGLGLARLVLSFDLLLPIDDRDLAGELTLLAGASF